jgi:uncharacterized protein (TIGR02722 family)
MTQISGKRMLLMLSFATSLGLLGCQTTQGNYADPNKIEIVDDKWNDSDARLAGETMIRSALSKRWLKEFRRETGKRPFVLVDDFENRTSEQIDTKAIFESVRNELINSGEVRFLDGAQRQKILDEYKYQQSGVVKQGSAKGPGKQQSSDFFLVGSLSSLVSEADGYKTVTYQVEMRLTNIETSEIVWTEVKKLKKQFRKSRFGL